MDTDNAFKVPNHINAELENWARWCKQDGNLPHPLPATEAPFARFVVTDKTTAWENREDQDGSIITVNLDDHVREIPVDTDGAKKVQAVYAKTTGWTRRVWNAEYIGFGEYSFSKHPIRRDLAAQKIGLSIHHFDGELQQIVGLLETEL